MGTAEGRSLAGVLAGVLLGVGLPQCVSAPLLGWSCIVIAAGLLSSLYFGWPVASLQIGIREGSMEGTPLVAPLTYQVDQVRQVIPQYHVIELDTHLLWSTFPKTTRKRLRSLYEPLPGVSLGPALEYLATTGELVRDGNVYRRGKSPTPWVRWKHGKDAKA